MKTKKYLVLLTVAILMFSFFTGCSYGSEENSSSTGLKTAMVTDSGGVYDQSFNQSTWEGLQNFKNLHNEVEIGYAESFQELHYKSNLEMFVNNGTDVIFGVGAALSTAVKYEAELNPDKNFILCDMDLDEIPSNMTTISFRSEESAFLVGYIAGRTTTTNKVGFIGGMENAGATAYQNAYNAGVMYAGKEKGAEIEVVIAYAESYSDISKGASIANKMYVDGCDVIFQSAGTTGLGVIQAAKEKGKYVIGADKDQTALAPDNVLTSAMKNIDKAVVTVLQDYYDGKSIGGQHYNFGLKEGVTGIAEKNKNLSDDVYNSALALQRKIKRGKIDIPTSEEELAQFRAVQ